MDQVELKNWAKEKIKGKIWSLFPAIFIAGVLSNLSFTYSTTIGDTTSKTSINLGFIFFFVQVGLTYFMINFITDREYKLNDIFSFSKDFGKDLCVGLVRNIFIVLWTFLFIVPGLMKAYAYALVPMLLTDERYKNLKATEILKKSEEMMNGHKMDLFVLSLSFIGWILLIPFTLGIICFWLVPYMETATTKFLYDVKCSYEGVSFNQQVQQPMQQAQQPMQQQFQQGQQPVGQPFAGKTCPHCGATVEADAQFCTSCGSQM